MLFSGFRVLIHCSVFLIAIGGAVVTVPICFAQEASEAPSDAEASSPAAVAAFSAAANFQNNQAYDLAADSWQKFLNDHPDDPQAMEATYNLAICRMQLKQLEQARTLLQKVVNSKTAFDRREEAALNLGWTIYSLALDNQPDLFPAADQAFAKLLKDFPQGEKRDQALFFRGESLYLQEKREAAEKTYRQLVEQFPDSPLRADAQYALGVTLEEMGRFADAGMVYDQFLEDFSENSLINEVKLRKAETVLRAGDLADAEQRFATLSKLPDFASADHALYRQAFAVARQQRFEVAAKLFSRLITEFPNSNYVQDSTIAAARSYFRAEQLDLASKWLRQVLDVKGVYAVEAAHWLARVHLKQGKPEAALKVVTETLPQANGNAFELNLLMDQADALYEMESRRAEAVALYAKLADDHPKSELAPQSLYNAAYGSMAVKDYENGLELAEQFSKAYPDHHLLPDVKNVVAECHLQLGDNEAAARVFADLAANSAERKEASQWKIREALALFAQKKYAESLERIEAKLPSMTDPAEQAEAYYLAGMNHFSLKQFVAAETAFKKSLQIQSDWRQADETLLNLSRAQRKQKKLAEARETVAHLIQEFPESPLLDQAHFRLAEYAYAGQDFETADREYAYVLEHFPESVYVPYAQYGRGWSSLRAGKLDLAEICLSTVIDGFPTHALLPQAVYARGMARQQAGDFERSLADIKKYLELGPEGEKRSDALYLQGLCFSGQKRFEDAVNSFRSILSDDAAYEGSDKVLYELAWALKSQKNSGESVDAFAQLCQQFPESRLAAESFYHVGEDAYGRKEYDQAAAAYNSSRSRLQGNQKLGEKVRYKLGWSHYQLNDFDQALTAFVEQSEKHPQGSLLGDALFMQGECHFRGEDHQAALTDYAAAAAQTLSSDAIKTLTYLHAGQSAGQLGKWKESLGWLEKIAAEQSDSPYFPQIQYEMAVAQQNLGNEAFALQAFEKVVATSRGEIKARAGFMMGELYYAKKEYLNAIREFRKVMFGFEQNAGEKVRFWQAKAGFEAGQCAGLVAAQKDKLTERQRFVDLAKKFFEYVVTQHPQSEEASAAANQLKKYAG